MKSSFLTAGLSMLVLSPLAVMAVSSPAQATDPSSSMSENLTQLSNGSTSLLTPQSSEATTAAQYGYVESAQAKVSTTPRTGLVGIRKLYKKSTNDSIWTANTKELKTAKRKGYVDQGVKFYAAATPSTGTVPMYRLQKDGKHLFTISAFEKDNKLQSGWNEGYAAFHVSPGDAVYVSPTGTGDGTTAFTATSVDKALNNGGKIMMTSGTYSRTSSMVVSKSGTVLTAAIGTRPVVSGMQKVSGWSQTGQNNIWKAPIPKGTFARQLYINGQEAKLVKVSASEKLGKIVQSDDSYSYTTEKDASWLSPSALLEWSGPGTGRVDWQLWTDRYANVGEHSGKFVRPPLEQMKLLHPTITHPDQADQGVGVFNEITNDPSTITQEGEYAIDFVNGYVYYKPLASHADMKKVTIEIPSSAGLLTGHALMNVKISGIVFEGSTRDLTKGDGFSEVQGAVHRVSEDGGLAPMDGAIDFSQSSGIVIDNVEVRKVAGTGIDLSGHGHNNVVQNSRVSDTGAGGIQLGTIYHSAYDTDNYDNKVTNNMVSRVGRTYKGGIGISAYNVKGTTISHNTVTDSNYDGISMGWSWGLDGEPGYAQSSGNNIIEKNLVQRTMQSNLSDGGGIYTLGNNSTGVRNIMRHNVVDNVGTNRPGDNGRSGLYLDGATNRWDVYENVVRVGDTNWITTQSVPAQQVRETNIYNNWSDSSKMVTTLWEGAPQSPTTKFWNNVTVGDPFNASPEAQKVVAEAGAH